VNVAVETGLIQLMNILIYATSMQTAMIKKFIFMTVMAGVIILLQLLLAGNIVHMGQIGF
jgi:hypothetical protein